MSTELCVIEKTGSTPIKKYGRSLPAQGKRSAVTVLVPAYNEGEHIADTIRSLQNQTVSVHEIIVIDDASSDNTAEVASRLGVRVVRPPRNTGTKAGAQNYGLQFVQTALTMAIDADTTLAPDAVEKLLPAFNDPKIAAACGFVIPRHVNTIWERGRYIEYVFAFTFYKPIQDFYKRPLISSGCFSMYLTRALKENGGWPIRTLAEDMDLTWSYYLKRYGIRFIPEAVCYPIEPHSFLFLNKQLKRWSHGFVQNVRLHWRHIRKVQYLNYMVTVAMWDAAVASIFYLILLPLLSIIYLNPFFLLGYVIDIPAVLVPTLARAIKRREVMRVLSSLPAFFVLRTVNGIFMLEAVWSEIIMKRSFNVYEKGH
jgi:poly-beta-1,6-N-acetyl-D-glucosamine synthase